MNSAGWVTLVTKCAEVEKANLQSNMDEAEQQRETEERAGRDKERQQERVREQDQTEKGAASSSHPWP